MDIAWFAAKQKRLKSWQLLASTLSDTRIVDQIVQRVATCSRILADAWSKRQLTDSDAKVFATLERELQQLAEDARLLGR